MLATFLMAFPALFSIVNPITGAFIFREATADRTHAERVARWQSGSAFIRCW